MGAENCPCVLRDPAAQVLLSDVDEFGRTLLIRAWLKSADYIAGPFALRQEAVSAFDEAGISLARASALSLYPKGSALLRKKVGKQLPEHVPEHTSSCAVATNTAQPFG